MYQNYGEVTIYHVRRIGNLFHREVAAYAAISTNLCWKVIIKANVRSSAHLLFS